MKDRWSQIIACLISDLASCVRKLYQRWHTYYVDVIVSITTKFCADVSRQVCPICCNQHTLISCTTLIWIWTLSHGDQDRERKHVHWQQSSRRSWEISHGRRCRGFFQISHRGSPSTDCLDAAEGDIVPGCWCCGQKHCTGAMSDLASCRW